ncbi:MAG: major capsid protein [Treponema sp.]|nr:major capsid protein [Treponema sp.]
MPKIMIRPEDIESVVAQNPPEESLAMEYFKRRPLKNSTFIAVEDIKREIGNVPVVRRGDSGIRPRMEASVELIEPMPIEIDDTFSAVELDEYERSSVAGRQQLVNEKLQQHLIIVRETTKALCVQAHSGKINYAMKSGASLVRYQVTYGDGLIKNVPFAKTLAALNVGDLIEAISKGTVALHDQLVGGPVDIIAAQDVFTAIVSLIASQKSFNATVGNGEVTLGGFRILLDSDSYVDIATDGTKTNKKLVPSRKLMFRAVNGGQSMPYLKLDDVVLREAVPIYSFTKDRDDQRGTNIFTKSKPFPLINTRAIVTVEFAA